MSFLRLSQVVLNTRYISSIEFNKNLYQINMHSNYTGFIFFGFSFFNEEKTIINVYKDKNEEDYNKITKWIENDFKKNF